MIRFYDTFTSIRFIDSIRFDSVLAQPPLWVGSERTLETTPAVGRRMVEVVEVQVQLLLPERHTLGVCCP